MSSVGAILLSDQIATQRAVDVVANNLANSTTTGFKRQGVQFETYISRQTPTQSTAYVYDRATFRDLAPGTISSTGNALDLAIQGEGYFQVQTPQGIQYTRDGAFHTDNQGQIVTSSGMPVLDEGGQAMTVPGDATDIIITRDGFVTVQSGTGTSRSELGKIGIVSFANAEGLDPTESNLLTTTQAATTVEEPVLIQGAIEDSNVSPVVEITNLITLQRAYERAANLATQENSRILSAIETLSKTTV